LVLSITAVCTCPLSSMAPPIEAPSANRCGAARSCMAPPCPSGPLWLRAASTYMLGMPALPRPAAKALWTWTFGAVDAPSMERQRPCSCSRLQKSFPSSCGCSAFEAFPPAAAALLVLLRIKHHPQACACLGRAAGRCAQSGEPGLWRAAFVPATCRAHEWRRSQNAPMFRIGTNGRRNSRAILLYSLRPALLWRRERAKRRRLGLLQVYYRAYRPGLDRVRPAPAWPAQLRLASRAAVVALLLCFCRPLPVHAGGAS
jgi:hypothetical protein